MWVTSALKTAGREPWVCAQASEHGVVELNRSRRAAPQEYAARVLAAVVVCESRRWMPAPLCFEWNVGKLRTMRGELVLATCAAAQELLAREKIPADWAVALRMLIFVALPYARRLVEHSAPPECSVGGVRRMIAVALLRLQRRALALPKTADELVARQAQWALDVLHDLQLPHFERLEQEMRAVILFAVAPLTVEQHQANLRAAVKVLSASGQAALAQRALARIDESVVPTAHHMRPPRVIGPVCAMSSRTYADEPWVHDSMQHYANDLTEKRDGDT